MRVRRPVFDLTGMTATWAPNHEWAHQINSANIIPTAIEPFLIKVMRRAKAELDPVADTALISDIDIFNRQEAQHYKTHDQFNEMIAASGYPEVMRFDSEMKADYDTMLATRSLEWLLGYCEGFESLAATGAHNWVDGRWGEYLVGADPRGIALWRWHLAEEYEHRTVVHRTYHRLCLGTSEEVYAKRMELFQYCTEHMLGYAAQLKAYFLEVDRASMTADERVASEQREQEVAERFEALQAGVAAVLEPSWDPERVPPPEHIEEVWARY